MTTANNPNNNLSPWAPGQSDNPFGRPRGTRDLAGYVLETTDVGKELVNVLVPSPVVSCPMYRYRKAPGPGRTSRGDQPTRPGVLQVTEGHKLPDTLYIFRLSKVHTVPESCLVVFNYFFKFRSYTDGQLWMSMERI